MAVRIDTEAFRTQILSPALSLVEFYSDSCVPCKRLSPLLAQIEEDHPDISIVKVNVAYEKDLAAELEVTATPTILFYKDGVQVGRQDGAVRRNQLEAAVEAFK